VSVGGAPVKLTSHEFRVLSYLMHHCGRVVSRTELTEHIYIEIVRGLGDRMREPPPGEIR
jgi:DNA-binding response OmpR family regulator